MRFSLNSSASLRCAGDVVGDVDRAEQLSLRVEHWAARDEEIAAEPLFADLRHVRPAVGQELRVRAVLGRPVRAVDVLVTRQPEALRGSDAQVLRYRPIGLHDAVLRVDHRDQVGNGVEGAFPLPLRPDQLLAGARLSRCR